MTKAKLGKILPGKLKFSKKLKTQIKKLKKVEKKTEKAKPQKADFMVSNDRTLDVFTFTPELKLIVNVEELFKIAHQKGWIVEDVGGLRKKSA